MSEPGQLEPLLRYIQEARNAGFTDEEVEKNLLEAGWHSELVEDAFKKTQWSPTSPPLEPQTPTAQPYQPPLAQKETSPSLPAHAQPVITPLRKPRFILSVYHRVFLVVLFVVLGGVFGGLYVLESNNPEKTIWDALEKSVTELKGFRFNLEIQSQTKTAEALSQTRFLAGLLAQVFNPSINKTPNSPFLLNAKEHSAITLTASGIHDFSNPLGFQLEVQGLLQGNIGENIPTASASPQQEGTTSLKLDFPFALKLVEGKTIFAKVDRLGPFLFFDLSPLTGKWIAFDVSQYTAMPHITSPSQQKEAAPAQNGPSLQRELLRFFLTHPVIAVQQLKEEDKNQDDSAARFSYSIEPEKIPDFLDDFISFLTDNTAIPQEQLRELEYKLSDPDLEDLFTSIQELSGQLWITPSGWLQRITVDLVLKQSSVSTPLQEPSDNQQKPQDTALSATFAARLDLSDHNRTFVVEAPHEYLALEEATKLLGFGQLPIQPALPKITTPQTPTPLEQSTPLPTSMKLTFIKTAAGALRTHELTLDPNEGVFYQEKSPAGEELTNIKGILTPEEMNTIRAALDEATFFMLKSEQLKIPANAYIVTVALGDTKHTVQCTVPKCPEGVIKIKNTLNEVLGVNIP